MGIFDFLKKKPNKTDKSNVHIISSERNTIVPLEYINEGNHGDHWAGIF